MWVRKIINRKLYFKKKLRASCNLPIFSVVENNCGIAKEHNAKRNNGSCEETEPKGVGRNVGPVCA